MVDIFSTQIYAINQKQAHNFNMSSTGTSYVKKNSQ